MRPFSPFYPPAPEFPPAKRSSFLVSLLKELAIYLLVRALALLVGVMMLLGLLYVLPAYLDWSSGRVNLAEVQERFYLGAFLTAVVVGAFGLLGQIKRSRRLYGPARRGRRRERVDVPRRVRYEAPFVKYPEYPAYWPELRQLVLDRDGYRCGNCGSRENLHVHHIVPLSVGGSNELGNLRTLCRECHARLHPHMRDSRPL